MIIDCLTLHNFGVYAGTNILKFQGRKPIVLIGGLNGRGKTTILEAVLLALYGENSFAFRESGYKSYSKYLNSYVNNNDGTLHAFVEIAFSVQEDRLNNYVVHRSWDGKNKIQREKIEVIKNGFYNEYLTKNWAMFIENLLPSALSSFFFFDGEKIADLAVDNTNAELKNSIRAMLGLGTLDSLENDLQRVINRNSKKIHKNISVEETERLRTISEQEKKEYEESDQLLQEKKKELQNAQTRLENLRTEYRTQGGEIAENSEKTRKEIAELQEQAEQNKGKMLEAAMSDLPMAMVYDLLIHIDERAQQEHQKKIQEEAYHNLEKIYQNYSVSKNSDELSHFIEYVKEQMRVEDTQGKEIFNLTDSAREHIHALANGGITRTIEETRELLYQQDNLLQEIDSRDEQLALDLNETAILDIRGQIKKLEEQINELTVELTTLESLVSNKHGESLRASSEFNKSVNELLASMESSDEAERTVQYAYLAKKILSEYTVTLQGDKVQELAKTITDCYKRLANKKTLIDRIQMNGKNLEITYVNEKGDPVEKEKLSAGEKQLMVIAILWALGMCSKKKLPVIIDTPLSRLDSEHRTSVVTTYFPNASEQTIILSTDTEIDEHYYNLIKQSVGDEYHLEYHEDTKSTTIEKGYFTKRA